MNGAQLARPSPLPSFCNSYHNLVVGLVVHMVLVGLPIAFSVQRFGRVNEPVDHQPVVS